MHLEVFLYTIAVISSAFGNVVEDEGLASIFDLDGLNVTNAEDVKQILRNMNQKLLESWRMMAKLEQTIETVKVEAQEQIRKVKADSEDRIKNEVRRELQETTQSSTKEFLRTNGNDIFDSVTKNPYGQMDDLEISEESLKAHVRVPRYINPLKSMGAANHTVLEQLIKLMVPVSCHQWRDYGFNQSGYYLIDADGRGNGEPPFTVYCDMISGYTFIHHNSEGLKNARTCAGPGCFRRKIRYGASKKQIMSLMQRSDSCEQYIKIDCHQTPLKKNRELLSWWVDRHGRRNSYWSGDAAREHMCACGQTGSCIHTSNACNCDADVRDIWLMDEGHLTNTSSLPVYELHFGGKRDRFLELKYTLGPLRCYGSRPVARPSSCMDLWISGVTQSGYYLLEVYDTIEAIYCNMSVAYLRDETGASHPPLTTSMGNVLSARHMQRMYEDLLYDVSTIRKQLREQLRRVAFTAYCTSHFRKVGSYVKFDRTPMNLGKGYDRNTGLFTAPKKGLYFFSAYLHNDDGKYRVKGALHKNGSEFARFRMDGGDIMEMTIGASAAEYLQKGDQVGVYLSDGRGDGSDGRTQVFSGFLVR